MFSISSDIGISDVPNLRRDLKGANQLPLVIEGVTFTNGVAQSATENRAASSGRVTQNSA